MTSEAALCPAVEAFLRNMHPEVSRVPPPLRDGELAKKLSRLVSRFTWQAAQAVEVASALSSAPAWRQLLQSLLPGRPAVPRQRLQGFFDCG